ncbi:MAG TPA: DUF1127 domain-containing protein [Salinisphaeraceae bacterium]|nr:DUF1127 domain-containing protein [Salinisphaeraceae bacterium]
MRNIIHNQHFSVSSLRQRRQLRRLLAHDDRTLADLGFARNEIRQALNLRRPSRNSFISNNIHLQDMHPERLHAHN